MTQLLDCIERPDQLKALAPEELAQLAQEMRQEIIQTVSLRGGHLAPNLGTVELILGLHIAFDTPRDKLVWDIGHQTYPHKLVTGRYKYFHTLKQLGGIAGYLRRDESPYDAFGASHASTSISAALGMAVARDLHNETYQVAAIIGDGALTGGMALEALNNAGASQRRFIVIINDNNKSISDNVGALHAYFAHLRSLKSYQRVQEVMHRSLEHMPGGEHIREMVERATRSTRQLIAPDKSGIIFNELGFTFLGPVDGHNIQQMTEAFRTAQTLDGPVMIHVVTQKGRGCTFAEANPTIFHGPSAYDPITGNLQQKLEGPPKYQDVFADALVDLARRDPSIVGITAAMAEGTSLYKLEQELPERYFDVGICEQHAVTFAAGMACQNLRPVVAIYSTFLQRAFDQIIHDVCVQNLHVVFPMDRAGIVGEDGPTQHGVFDIAFMRMIPNMKVMAPKDENELRHMLYTALYLDGPVALRYPRGAGVGVPIADDFQMLPVGKAELLTPENEVALARCAIFGYGHMVSEAMQAARILKEKGIFVAVINARWANPLDEELILKFAALTKCLITVEDGVAAGGFGSAVNELLQKYAYTDVRLSIVALPPVFVEHGPAKILREHYGLCAKHIVELVRSLIRQSELTVPVEPESEVMA
jgi:1-deoxy-D-xylulose-5-phosphate synthase